MPIDPQPDFQPNYAKPRFDGTVNLGHLLTVVSMVGALLTFFVTMRESVSRLDARVQFLERAQVSMVTTMDKLSDNQTSLVRAQDRITILFEQQAKQQQRNP